MKKDIAEQSTSAEKYTKYDAEMSSMVHRPSLDDRHMRQLNDRFNKCFEEYGVTPKK